jgi:phage terminase Nu1 subunit (DNA packaging protein)
MLQIMQLEITTAEAADLFSVTRKTVALWAQQGIMVKLRHGVFDLKESLQNWVAYQRCVFEGADNPMDLWQIRRDIAYAEAQRPREIGVGELRSLDDLVTL